jgi:hypothetical protein
MVPTPNEIAAGNRRRAFSCDRAMKLAIIAIVLIDITLGAIWLYRPTYPTAQPSARWLRPPESFVVRAGEDFMAEPRIPEAARSDYCTLHRKLRIEASVPISYGTPMPDATYYAYQRAKSSLFPNAWSGVEGGCALHAATRAVVRFCPECRTAERNWKTTRD